MKKKKKDFWNYRFKVENLHSVALRWLLSKKYKFFFKTINSVQIFFFHFLGFKM